MSLTEYGFGDGQEYAPRTNLKAIEGTAFRIAGIRDTPFDDAPDAVTIKTSESYHVNFTKKNGEVVDGTFNEFYATWPVVTSHLKNEKLRADVAAGKFEHKLKLVRKPSQKRKGAEYYDLVPA